MPAKGSTPIGERFGRLVVLSRDPESKPKHPRWICQCDCGAIKSVVASYIRYGDTRSCGCLQRDLTAERSTLHGGGRRGKKLPEYTIWAGMRDRCHRRQHRDYPLYGGRGIVVCERWNSFANFYADMGPRPSIRHSIDRADSNGPYSPENCRWATPKEQAGNTRRNLWLTHNGRSMILQDWAIATGIKYTTLYHRLTRSGWDAERALTTPVR